MSIDQQTVVFSTGPMPPSCSWWIGCDDEEFTRRQRAELPRLRSVRLPKGLREGLERMDDVST